MIASEPLRAGLAGLPKRPESKRPDQRWIAAKSATVMASLGRPALPAALTEPLELASRDGAVEPEISPEQRLLQRATFGPTAFDFEQLDRIGYYPWLARQLNYESLDDRELERVLHEALPVLSMSPAEIAVNYFEMIEQPIFQLWIAELLRSIYSPRQLYERVVGFWTDHFNIDIFGDYGWLLKPVDDRDVVRQHAMGDFRTLLGASAHSPAMLAYLTNITNNKDDPNENYARELMELHTLGADNGYTQEDVREVSRCFTGWTIRGDFDAEFGRFRFEPALHDFGQKVVLGNVIPAGGGVEDGERVLDILAAHPNTARFISEKLLRRFWGYEPPRRYVDQAAQRFMDTGGDIRSMLQFILKSRWMATATPKLKRPYHLVISSLRATFGNLNEVFYPIIELFRMGNLPYGWGPPDGYPDSRGYWSGYLLNRWNFASRMVIPDESGVVLPLAEFLSPTLRPDTLTQRIDLLLSNQTFTDRTLNAVRNFLRAGRSPARVAEALGLALAAPEFQDY